MEILLEAKEKSREKYPYCLYCQEYPEVIIKIRRQEELGYEVYCANCTHKLNFVD